MPQNDTDLDLSQNQKIDEFDQEREKNTDAQPEEKVFPKEFEDR